MSHTSCRVGWGEGGGRGEGGGDVVRGGRWGEVCGGGGGGGEEIARARHAHIHLAYLHTESVLLQHS